MENNTVQVIKLSTKIKVSLVTAIFLLFISFLFVGLSFLVTSTICHNEKYADGCGDIIFIVGPVCLVLFLVTISKLSSKVYKFVLGYLKVSLDFKENSWAGLVSFGIFFSVVPIFNTVVTLGTYYLTSFMFAGLYILPVLEIFLCLFLYVYLKYTLFLVTKDKELSAQ